MDALLDSLHVQMFEKAKTNFVAHGRLLPCAAFVFESDSPAAALERAGLPPGMALAEHESHPKVRVAIVPTMLTPASALEVFLRLHPEMREHVEDARNHASTVFAHLGPEFNPDDSLLRAILSVVKWSYPDLVAENLKWVARKLEAFAILKVDETWMARTTTNHATGPVKDIPGRQEAVTVSLETRTRQALRVAPILRAKPGDDNSAFIGFGTETHSLTQLSGRFFRLLERAAS